MAKSAKESAGESAAALRARILAWAEEQSDEANGLYESAEAARQESDFTDVDALEQSCYNEGVLDTLESLRRLLVNGAPGVAHEKG